MIPSKTICKRSLLRVQLLNILQTFDSDAVCSPTELSQFLSLRGDLVEVFLHKRHDDQHLIQAEPGDVETVLFLGAGRKLHAAAHGLQQESEGRSLTTSSKTS